MGGPGKLEHPHLMGDVPVNGFDALITDFLEQSKDIAIRVLGGGKRLFGDGIGTKVLDLVDTRTFDSGAVVFTYRPTGG